MHGAEDKSRGHLCPTLLSRAYALNLKPKPYYARVHACMGHRIKAKDTFIVRLTSREVGADLLPSMSTVGHGRWYLLFGTAT